MIVTCSFEDDKLSRRRVDIIFGRVLGRDSYIVISKGKKHWYINGFDFPFKATVDHAHHATCSEKLAGVMA